MASYLVTGAAGMIGAEVTRQLLAQGDHIVGIDNLNDAYDVRLKHWRLAQVGERPDFEFHRVDITDRAAIASAITTPVDAIINLAARAGVRYSVENPWVYVETNVIGCLNLLELARERGIKKFVLASTSSMYGGNTPQPFVETAVTDEQLSPYAASKKGAEAMCYTYHYLHGLDITVPRYFTVYGPAGRPDMALFRFVQWIAEGRPVAVFGDGSARRDFTNVADIARGTIAALRPVGYEVINMGSDQPVAVIDAIRLIEELLGKPATIDYRPPNPSDVPATWANVDKAQRLLDWRPSVGFREGVEAIVRWYQANREWAKDVVTL
ncbi:MAG: SDR family NAD(P)-dependent oxidoreductase [Dehalococcoidia bacterium]|nr:SDR family NAD(P)-dependent oxidoreductase [Dehalococcoidia bacterium]